MRFVQQQEAPSLEFVLHCLTKVIGKYHPPYATLFEWIIECTVAEEQQWLIALFHWTHIYAGMLKQNDINAAWLGFCTSFMPVEEQDVINTQISLLEVEAILK